MVEERDPEHAAQLPAPVAGSTGAALARFEAATALLDGYIHESTFLPRDLSANHRIVWASEGFETVFGCTVQQYNQNGIWGGCYSKMESEAALQRAMALRRGQTVEAELRLMRPDGEVRWLYVKNKPIFDNGGGQVTGVLGVGLDITRRKIAEMLLATIQSIKQGVAPVDADSLLLRACGNAFRTL